MAQKRDIQLDVNQLILQEKELKKAKNPSINPSQMENLNYDLVKAVDKATDVNPDLIDWLCNDPFYNSPDALLNKNWVPRSRKNYSKF